MANGTKAAKLRKYFKNNPEATTKEAAAWAKCSYGNAWSIKQEFCKKAVTGTDFPNARTFKSVVDDTGATKIELSHPPTKKLRATVEELKAQRAALQALTAVSDGSTASYYELPQGAKELQDLISYKDMNAQIGEIFRATYRYGQSSHSDKLRDAKKIRFYIDAEIKRLGG
tara:strand:+ start:1037 stop:1549 length:513 start_codon:yes stop_codon:yes gene_type:complete